MLTQAITQLRREQAQLREATFASPPSSWEQFQKILGKDEAFTIVVQILKEIQGGHEHD